jgi:cytochrome c biogenesis protein CcdA
MKRLLNYILVFLLFFCFAINVNGKEKIKVYFFHGDGCPHCAKEEIFLKEIKEKYKEKINIIDYETWNNDDNKDLMLKVKEYMGANINQAVPFTVIGKKNFTGYSESIGDDMESNLQVYLGEKQKTIIDEQTKKIPIIGEVNVKETSVLLIAIIFGLVDGFNPCAMWVLLFLISALIGMKDRKRMFTIGFAFILTSGLVYLAILLSWINIVVKVSTSVLFRNIIALVAIIGGLINLRSYINSLKEEDGCDVVDDKKRKKIFTKIKTFTKEKSLLLAILGAMGLAVSVNIVELACSAGLPLVFSELLTINNISGISSLPYVLLYILFFLIDDIIVFTIAIITMTSNGISSKFNKYSHLVGGIIMLIIGLLLIFKPGWLMFTFK